MDGTAAARLGDIVEAIELIEDEVGGVSMAAFAADKRKRWLVERGLEIISEASRRLPDELKARHPTVPWRKVAGIGNVLRHEYEHLAYDVLWRVVADECRRWGRFAVLSLRRWRRGEGIVTGGISATRLALPRESLMPAFAD